MAGTTIPMMDYCNDDPSDAFATQTCTPVEEDAMLDVYRHSDVTMLNEAGSHGHPLREDDERWVGRVPIEGKSRWVVGLFNRTDTTQARTIDFDHDLGVTRTVKLKDLWTGQVEPARGGYEVGRTGAAREPAPPSQPLTSGARS